MLLASDVSATFYPSTFQGSSMGVGQLNICGIVINFTVYPSQYGQGILVSFPSKPVIKNGEHVMENGKKKYNNEVYVADRSIQPIIDNAVLQAMQNKGVTVNEPTQQANTQYNGGGSRDFNTPVNKPRATSGYDHTQVVGAITGDDLPF